MRVLGVLITFAILLWSTGIDPKIFLNVHPWAIVISASILGFIAAAGKRSLQLGPLWVKALVGTPTISMEHIILGISACQTAIRTSIAGGFSAAIIGFIQMLTNLDDPYEIGPALALAMLGMLYSIILSYLILLPLQTSLEKRLAEKSDGTISPNDTPLDLLVLAGGIIVSVVTYAVLMASF